MRARMALVKSGITPILREVELKNKPAQMLEASPKGTVPVLVLPDGTVIDESRDIMMWALTENDPDGWLSPAPELVTELIDYNDQVFKKALDRYKYPGRYPDEDCSGAQALCEQTFESLDERILENKGYLADEKLTIADIAIFPFIRQAAHVDKAWFDKLPLPRIRLWLQERIESDLFTAIMEKTDPWQADQTPVYLYSDTRING